MDIVTKAVPREDLEKLDAKRQAVQKLQEQAAKEPPRFVDGAEKRSMAVKLEYPVEHEGTIITEVIIRRPTMREWREYLRACDDAKAVGGEAAEDLVDRPWLSIPAFVLENLDFGDVARIEGAESGFFARSSSPREEETAEQSPQE